jgi:hypothetical protein
MSVGIWRTATHSGERFVMLVSEPETPFPDPRSSVFVPMHELEVHTIDERTGEVTATTFRIPPAAANEQVSVEILQAAVLAEAEIALAAALAAKDPDAGLLPATPEDDSILLTLGLRKVTHEALQRAREATQLGKLLEALNRALTLAPLQKVDVKKAEGGAG